MTLKIGADPELFVSRDGNIFSGHGLISGNKKHPHAVNNGAVQVDGMALEFNIDPASTETMFVNNVVSVLGQMKAMIPDDCELEMVPVAHFTPEYLELQPKEAKEIGCDPDYSAYTGAFNPMPDATRPMRTAAGHIHIGWRDNKDTSDHMFECVSIARQMDYFLGIPSLLLDPDNTRRSMYGKAGAFRPKNYGVEYRTLSNFWITSVAKMRFVYGQVKAGMEALEQGTSFYTEYGDTAKAIIDENNVNDALAFVNEHGWATGVADAQ